MRAAVLQQEQKNAQSPAAWRIAVNAVAFQACWFGVVLLASANKPLLATAVGLATAALHLHLSQDRTREFSVMIATVLVGFIVEAILLGLGFVSYAFHKPILFLPPAWLVALWLAFGTLPNTSLEWLKRQPALAAFLGALAGSISYYAAERLHAVTLAEPLWVTYTVISGLWAVTLALIMSVADRSNRSDRT